MPRKRGADYNNGRKRPNWKLRKYDNPEKTDPAADNTKGKRFSSPILSPPALNKESWSSTLLTLMSVTHIW